MCPDCQIMPLRVWDTFVVPIDNFAMGVVYATDNGAERRRGRGRRPRQHQFARARLRVRRRAGGGADAGLLATSTAPTTTTRPTTTRRSTSAARSPTPRRTRPARARAGCPRHRRRRPAAAGGVRGGLRRASSASLSDRPAASPPSGAAAHDQLLPQLEPDPVRRQGRHRADGLDRLGEHRPGLGRRRPARLVRPRGVRRRATRSPATRSASC